MDSTDPNSGVFIQSWKDVETVVDGLDEQQCVRALIMFTARMSSKEATGVSMVHQEIYAMRAALKYALTGEFQTW